jgi:hypothetical protein
MRVHLLERAQRLEGTPEEIFGFFADAHNLESITPPLLRFEVLRKSHTRRTSFRPPSLASSGLRATSR